MAVQEDRRDALKIIGAVGTTCAFPFASDELWGQTQAHAHAAAHASTPTASTPYIPRFFSEPEWKLVSRLADLIIPATDSPGALAAGVPAYIDMVLSENPAQGNGFRRGAEWLETRAREHHGAEFLSLTEAHQIALLTPLCEAVDSETAKTDGELFFGMVKKLTADGFFTSKAGLIDALGYKGNAVRSEFPGCIHEH